MQMHLSNSVSRTLGKVFLLYCFDVKHAKLRRGFEVSSGARENGRAGEEKKSARLRKQLKAFSRSLHWKNVD